MIDISKWIRFESILSKWNQYLVSFFPSSEIWHLYREHNSEADSVENKAIELQDQLFSTLDWGWKGNLQPFLGSLISQSRMMKGGISPALN